MSTAFINIPIQTCYIRKNRYLGEKYITLQTEKSFVKNYPVEKVTGNIYNMRNVRMFIGSTNTLIIFKSYELCHLVRFIILRSEQNWMRNYNHLCSCVGYLSLVVIWRFTLHIIVSLCFAFNFSHTSVGKLFTKQRFTCIVIQGETWNACHGCTK